MLERKKYGCRNGPYTSDAAAGGLDPHLPRELSGPAAGTSGSAGGKDIPAVSAHSLLRAAVPLLFLQPHTLGSLPGRRLFSGPGTGDEDLPRTGIPLRFHLRGRRHAHDSSRQPELPAAAGRETLADRPDLRRDQSEPSDTGHARAAQGSGGQPPVGGCSVLPGSDPPSDRQIPALRIRTADPAAPGSRPWTFRYLERGYDLQLPHAG